MQQGSIIQAERKIGPNVWEFRWREPGPDGKRKHRRMVIGRIDQLVDESAHVGGLLVSILTSISGTHDSRVSPSR